MKKTGFILYFSAVLVLFGSMYYMKANYNSRPAEITLVKAFEMSGARIESCEMYFWGKLNSSDSKKNALKKLADDFVHSMGISKDGLTYSNVSNQNNEKIEYHGSISEGNAADLSLQLEKKSDGSLDEIVTVNITEDSKYLDFDKVRKTVSSVFKKYKTTPKVNTCIIGSFDGKMNEAQVNSLCERIIKGADAKKIDEIKDRDLISTSAYSRSISSAIRSNGRKINLSLAVRYNSTENKTYIWLATPVITIEY